MFPIYPTNTEYPMGTLGYPQYSITLHGRIRNNKTNVILKPFIDRHGYANYSLWSNRGTRKTMRVHQLVAQMYIPNPHNLPQVNHIDGNKLNNYYLNLEWASNRDNAHHALRTGLMPHAQINDQICHRICEMLMQKCKISKIARDLNVPYSTVAAIWLRRNWTHISSQYNLPPVPKRKKRSV